MLKRKKTFFEKLAGHTSVLWKLCAGLLFVGFGLAILLVPSITQGLESTTTRWLAIGLILYGLYRAGTFYAEYKTLDDE